MLKFGEENIFRFGMGWGCLMLVGEWGIDNNKNLESAGYENQLSPPYDTTVQ